jgi:hypothetical protein
VKAPKSWKKITATNSVHQHGGGHGAEGGHGHGTGRQGS